MNQLVWPIFTDSIAIERIVQKNILYKCNRQRLHDSIFNAHIFRNLYVDVHNFRVRICQVSDFLMFLSINSFWFSYITIEIYFKQFLQLFHGQSEKYNNMRYFV